MISIIQLFFSTKTLLFRPQRIWKKAIMCPWLVLPPTYNSDYTFQKNWNRQGTPGIEHIKTYLTKIIWV
jgi:hypothetical protein